MNGLSKLNHTVGREPSLGSTHRPPNDSSLTIVPRSSASASRTGPSHAIIIDSDDEMEEVKPSNTALAVTNKGTVVRSEEIKRQGISLEARDAIKVALANLDAEVCFATFGRPLLADLVAQIKSVVAQLEPLQTLHETLTAERSALESQLCTAATQQLQPVAGSSKTVVSNQIDYQSTSFPWSSAVFQTLKSIFHLSSFRLCQEGVINAAMDDRDIVCVMPTGGGKSLTYQLPAIMGGKGLTVVISPLLALIWDQVRALREIGVECVASDIFLPLKEVTVADV